MNTDEGFDAPPRYIKALKKKTGCLYCVSCDRDSFSQIHSFKNSCKAKFSCSECGHKWTSLRCMAILSWWDNKSFFDIVVFGQQCQSCEEDFFEPDIYDDEWTRLIAKFASILNENAPPKSSKKRNGKMKSPHQTEHCQACKLGLCNQDDDDFTAALNGLDLDE